MVELLAPAGSREAFIAAVESGANAVYLAGNKFGARAYASNFDEDGLRETVHEAHIRHVRIHVAVNTILEDGELAGLAAYLQFLDSLDVDAVLVQDLGVARVAREIVPHLPLHASTQMTVNSLEGVQALARLGFSRVVLARELSIKEIRHICANTDVEIEIFMHGALCVCYSGQCLMSSMIGGRSGNRGRCAQPCRLPYTLVDEHGKDVLGDGAGDFLLSPRDLNTIDVLPELIDAGVASLKIEGRMKRPEYVATVVGTYRKALDAYETGKAYRADEKAHDRLAQIFNRDFTTAYLVSRPGKAMMSDRRPNNRGLLVGRVTAYDRASCLVSVKLAKPLFVGDQVDFWVKVGGRVAATVTKLTGLRGETLAEGMAGDVVTFEIPSAVREHDRVFKVYDAKLMAEAKQRCASGSPIRRVAVDCEVSARLGDPLTIRMVDADGNVGEGRTAFIAEVARKRPLTEETVRRQVERLGTTIFSLRSFSCTLGEAVMVPMSEINEARRRAVAALEAARIARMKPAEGHYSESVPHARRKPENPPHLMVAVATLDAAKAALDAGADGILFGGESYSHHVITEEAYRSAWKFAQEHGARIDFNTPRIVRDCHQKALENLLHAFAAFPPAAIHVHNIGTLSLVRRMTDMPIHADYSLISYNQKTLQFLKEYGAAEATLSPELTLVQIGELADKSPIPLTAIVHGRLELMVSEYCVTGSFLGGAGNRACSQPCTRGRYALKDRKDMLFPLAMDQFCHMHILNSKCLSMLPFVRKLRHLGIRTLRIEGKALSEAEITRLVRAYRHAERLPEELDATQLAWVHEQEGKDITRGHYFRGVL